MNLSSAEIVVTEARQVCDSNRQRLIQEVLHITRQANDLFNIHTAAKVLSTIEAYETEAKTKMAGGQQTMVSVWFGIR